MKKHCENYPDVKKLKKGKSEYWGISKDPKVSKEQTVSIFECWNDFVKSELITNMRINDVNEALVKFDVLEESQYEEDAESSQ